MSDNTGDDLHPVVKMSVVTTDNILSQDNSHLDHRTRCSNIPPRLKPISISHSTLSLFLSLRYHNLCIVVCSFLDHRTKCSNIPLRLKPISISHSNLSLFLSLHYHNFFKAINIKHSFLDTSQRKEFW